MKFSLFKSARSFSRQSVRNSRKPSEACERIERCCDGPCLDPFAPAANETRAVVASENGDAA
jgi:hypothetical protein